MPPDEKGIVYYDKQNIMQGSVLTFQGPGRIHVCLTGRFLCEGIHHAITHAAWRDKADICMPSQRKTEYCAGNPARNVQGSNTKINRCKREAM